MAQKKFAVIGAGQFGQAISLALSEKGFEVLVIDKDMKTVLQFKYPEDRMSLKAGETLVLDFGSGAERPVLDTRVSTHTTVRLRTANTLDGRIPVFLPGSSTAECRPFEDRSEPSSSLTPGRYLAVSADKAVSFTKIAVRADNHKPTLSKLNRG